MELALVQLTGDKRPVTVYDLTDGVRNRRRRDTTKITVDANDDTKAVISGTWSIQAQTATELTSLIQTFTRKIARPGPDEFVEWKTPPASYPVYFKRAGKGTAQLQTTAYQHGLYRRAIFDVSIPVEMPRMMGLDILDDFAVDSLGDYTYDSGSGLTIVSGKLFPGTIGTKELYHSARGHLYEDVEVTAKYTTTSALSAGTAVGVAVKRLDGSNYLWVDVLNNVLRIAKKDAGVETALNTGGTAARAADTPYWIRVRVEGNLVTAEHWLTEPTPMGAPATSITYTLAGGNATKFGVGIAGQAGMRLTFETATLPWSIDDLTVRAFVYRNQTLPAQIPLGGTIPGDEPALLDLAVTPSGGSAAPVFAAVCARERPTAPSGGAVVPFGVLEAESAGSVSGWASGADAGSHAGNRLAVTTSGAGTAVAQWTIDPVTLRSRARDEDFVDVQVFADVEIASTVVQPSLTLSWFDALGRFRYSAEFGTAGKLLPIPNSGTARRFVFAGTIRLPVDSDQPGAGLSVAAAWAAGSSGVLALDYVALFAGVASLPVGIPGDASYPDLVPSTSQATRTFRADGTGLAALPPSGPTPDVGLGSDLTLEPGLNDLLVKLSSLVPDDPTVSADTEQLGHAATVHARVIPRVSLLRGS